MKELIDFENWVKNTRSKGMSELVSNMINDYLKSINSKAQNETPNVNNNEGKKEDYFCVHPDYRITKMCDMMGNNFCKNTCFHRAK